MPCEALDCTEKERKKKLNVSVCEREKKIGRKKSMCVCGGETDRISGKERVREIKSYLIRIREGH